MSHRIPTIRRNANVRVVNIDSLHVSRVGVVESVSRVSNSFTVRLLQTATQAEVVATFERDDLKHDNDVSTFELTQLIERHDVLAAEEAAKQSEYEARAKQREIDAYLEQRNANVAPLEREQRDHGVIFGQRRACSNGVDTYISDRITIYTHSTFGRRHTPSVSVNWSALGSVTPEEALAFAQSLAAAAVEAMAIRSQRERELGISI